ncbi:MFS transporter [Pallidibacillus thermolactis]|uniref:MFS transporter n=1 Tax=Pallidibacillus thermolactis TaxID=251051 RepID=UPI0021DB4998|nr:MFS transporter [Pallidibacillus thermolactis]MCU9602568.1 MFS transporter [Pallidibacillus thermolactis subsp. kokeshiiformis]
MVCVEITSSAIATAIIGSFTHISGFFIGPIAGVFADRSKNPKSLFSWILRFNTLILLIMVVCIYILTNEFEIFAVFVLVAIREISFDLLYPVQTRIIPLIVPKDGVTKLLGYRSDSSNIASILGNAISGFVISLVCIIGGFILNSITFFLSSILISLLKLLQTPQNSKEKDLNNGDDQNLENKRMKIKKEILEGGRILWNNTL